MVFIIFPHTIPESYHRKSVPIASKYPGTILEKNVSHDISVLCVS